MSKEHLAQFAALIAEPLFVSVRDVVVPEGLKMVFGCDACGAQKIDPVVRSYADPTHELCQKCYNRLRRAATDKEVVRQAEAAWQKANEDTLIEQAANIRAIAEQRAVNDQIVSDTLARMGGVPPLTAGRREKKRRTNADGTNVPLWQEVLDDFRAITAAARKKLDEEIEQ